MQGPSGGDIDPLMEVSQQDVRQGKVDHRGRADSAGLAARWADLAVHAREEQSAVGDAARPGNVRTTPIVLSKKAISGQRMMSNVPLVS